MIKVSFKKLKQMKTRYFLLALAVVSCSQNDIIDPIQGPVAEPEMVTIKFSADKAGATTRTAAVEGESEVNYIWTPEDEANMKLFLVDKSVTPEVVTPVATYTATKESDTRLTISATVASAPSYTFRAVLVSNINASDEPVVAAEQSPETDNFDPAADLLVSEDLTTTGTSGLVMHFNRKIVVNKMTLRGLTAGEKVCRVSIASDKYLTGSYADGAFSGIEKAIVLTYDKETVGLDGNFPVYFTSIPAADQTLTVDVATDQHTYTKTFGAGGIDFNQDEFTRFGVTLTGFDAPVADLLDAIFLADGTASNLAAQTKDSPMTIVTHTGSYLSTIYDPTYGRYFARFGRDMGSESYYDSYYSSSYASLSEVKNTLKAAMTMEALVKISPDASVGNGEYKFFSSHQSGGFGLIMKGSYFKWLPYLGGWFWTPENANDSDSNLATKNVYYHVVGTWSNEDDETRLYVNGTLVNTRSTASELSFPQSGSEWVGIGGDPMGGNIAQVWQGDIAIARLYGRALSGSEVAQLYSRVTTGLGL